MTSLRTISLLISVLVVEISTILLISALSILLLVHVTTATHLLHILFDQIDHLIGNSQIFNGAAANVAFVHLPELVTVLQQKHQNM